MFDCWKEKWFGRDKLLAEIAYGAGVNEVLARWDRLLLSTFSIRIFSDSKDLWGYIDDHDIQERSGSAPGVYPR